MEGSEAATDILATIRSATSQAHDLFLAEHGQAVGRCQLEIITNECVRFVGSLHDTLSLITDTPSGKSFHNSTDLDPFKKLVGSVVADVVTPASQAIRKFQGEKYDIKNAEKFWRCSKYLVGLDQNLKAATSRDDFVLAFEDFVDAIDSDSVFRDPTESFEVFISSVHE